MLQFFFLAFAVWRGQRQAVFVRLAGKQRLVSPNPRMSSVGSTLPGCDEWQVAGRSEELLHRSVGNRGDGRSAE